MPHELAEEMRVALDDPYVRSRVTEAVRRRVPREDVSDVAQAVFCDALSSETGPETPSEIRYWLVGVARFLVRGGSGPPRLASPRVNGTLPMAAPPVAAGRRS